MKIITFAVPCYNSEAYMDKCISSLLQAGSDAEIILIDDGSQKDRTPAICDAYAEKYPDIIRVIHQQNGGHGEGVNQGIRHASGLYYKVVDSDDWLDADALQKVMKQLRDFAASDHPVDMVVCNYVYEHAEDNTSRAIHYRSVFPTEKRFTWSECGRFRPGQYLLMHSVIYRTGVLRGCGIELPKHTFYVDNIFVYYPLPAVQSIYYMDVDLYRYYIGRADQSVNEQVMVKRQDQQILVTRLMFSYYNLKELGKTQPRLAAYMFGYLSMMLAICMTLLNLDGSPEALSKRKELWDEMMKKHPELCPRMRILSTAAISHLPGRVGRKAEIGLYHIADHIFHFN